MSILVIGNGFDLAHHLPTLYSNFLDCIKVFKEESGDREYLDFINGIMENNEMLYSEIQTLIYDNVLLEYFLSIYEDRCKNGKKGWIDFESEISVIVQKLDEAKQYIHERLKGPNGYVELEEGILQYLRLIIVPKSDAEKNMVEYSYQPRFFDYQANRVLDSLNRLTRLLEIYLHEYVEKIDCKYRIPVLNELCIDRVLSFNYTDTYKKYYDPDGIAKYCYIHGKTKNGSLESCDLVLGIDEYLPPERKDTDNEFIWFKKFYQRIYKETGSEYLDWINGYEEYNKRAMITKLPQNQLYFYGHSLDVTDKDVLSRLILMENTITHIFYHSREAMAKQINNLVKIIGEDNLIRMTGGKDRTIRFIYSQPSIKDEKEL